MLCACWRDRGVHALTTDSLASRCLHTSYMLIVHVGLVWASTFVVIRKAYCSWSSCKLTCMESNTNNISSAGLHRLDQRQRRSATSEEVDVRQGQNALGSLLLSTALTPSHSNRLHVFLSSYFVPTTSGEVSVAYSGGRWCNRPPGLTGLSVNFWMHCFCKFCFAIEP